MYGFLAQAPRHLARALVLVAALAGAARAEARRVFLWYADGGPLPPTMPALCTQAPPRYQCTFAGGTLADCRAAVQGWLDRWYADFDLVFTYQPPAEGPYDTVIIASEASWCFGDATTTSRSLEPKCPGVPSGSLVVFQCGADARKCASIIAQEQAHLLGLEHTSSPTDVMNASFPPDHDGFENREVPTTSTECRRVQSSYQLMLERLGPWPGGAKPAPLPASAPPGDAGATPEPTPPDAGAPALRPASSGGGCAVVADPPAGAALVWLALAALTGKTARQCCSGRSRRRCGATASRRCSGGSSRTRAS
jgi:hypothetical protein